VRRLRGHKQYTAQTPAMTKLAAIHQNRQSTTVCSMGPPGLPRGVRSRIAHQHAPENGWNEFSALRKCKLKALIFVASH
jgi:hypothetical protein